LPPGQAGPSGRVGEVETLQHLACPGACRRAGEAEQPADHDQVLGPGQLFVYRGILAGQRDELANLHGLGYDVVAADARPAAVRPEQGGQDAHDGGLAGPVRSEQRQYLSALSRDVHSGERLRAAEPFRQPLGLDYGGHGCLLSPVIVVVAIVSGSADTAPSAR
jgi:hypothetical protein